MLGRRNRTATLLFLLMLVGALVASACGLGGSTDTVQVGCNTLPAASGPAPGPLFILLALAGLWFVTRRA